MRTSMMTRNAMKKFGATDNLDLMLKMQGAFQRRVDDRCFSNNPEVRAEFVRDHVNYMNNEVAEMLQEMPYFKRWKNYDKMTETEREDAYKAMKNEYVDVLHFFINLGVALGFTSDELTDMYVIKNAENIRRQDEGYDHTMKHVEANEPDRVAVHLNGTTTGYENFLLFGFTYTDDLLDGVSLKSSDISVAELIAAKHIIEMHIAETCAADDATKLYAAAFSEALSIKDR